MAEMRGEPGRPADGDHEGTDGDPVLVDGAVIKELEPLLALAGRRELLTDAELLARIDRMLAAAVEVLTVDSVGLMLLDDRDQLRRVGATHAVADRLETAQSEAGQGPGVDSVRTGKIVAVADLSAAPDYGDLWNRVSDTGVRAVLSSPVRVDQEPIGNLNAVLYRPHTWSGSQLRANQAYADVIGLALKTVAQARNTAGRVNLLQSRLGMLPQPGDRHHAESPATEPAADHDRTTE